MKWKLPGHYRAKARYTLMDRTELPAGEWVMAKVIEGMGAEADKHLHSTI